MIGGVERGEEDPYFCGCCKFAEKIETVLYLNHFSPQGAPQVSDEQGLSGKTICASGMHP
jgi:hypothetical protein